jgi:hypothetical protein
VVAVIHGKWDGEIYLHDKRKNEEHLMWCPTKTTIESRLKRYIVPLDEQKEFESEGYVRIDKCTLYLRVSTH